MKPILAALVVLLLASCAGSDMIEPVGIGSGRDDLKRSPCACMPVPQDYASWS